MATTLPIGNALPASYDTAQSTRHVAACPRERDRDGRESDNDLWVNFHRHDQFAWSPGLLVSLAHHTCSVCRTPTTHCSIRTSMQGTAPTRLTVLTPTRSGGSGSRLRMWPPPPPPQPHRRTTRVLRILNQIRNKGLKVTLYCGGRHNVMNRSLEIPAGRQDRQSWWTPDEALCSCPPLSGGAPLFASGFAM